MKKIGYISKVLKALSDETRLKIVCLLSYRPHCVCELSNIIGYSQPTITRHLQILTSAGILKFKKEKFFVIYYLSPEDKFIEDLVKILIEKAKELSFYSELLRSTTPDLPLKVSENFLRELV